MANQGHGKLTGPRTHTTRQPEATPAARGRPRKADREAVRRTDSLAAETDEAPDQTILGEFQRGYRFKGRLLRPSMVRVAVHP